MKNNKGFTLIELLVVIGIIAILAGVVIVALNPARQFGQARDTQRSSNVNAILEAIGQRMADNRGTWSTNCGGTTVTFGTTSDQAVEIGSASGLVDLATCLVPTYISQMVYDPVDGNEVDTNYTISKSAAGRITIAAPQTEIASPAISSTR